MGTDKPQFRSIDPSKLPKHFDAPEAEQRWDRFWDERGTFAWDPSRPRDESFVIDTPPPTVSGSLHIGHVFSYTHTDVLARYKRMTGLNVFYPMGWDDNGLPTERRVQNYFHVRCDPNAPFEEVLEIEPASAKQRKSHPRLVSRPNFIDLCERVTVEDEKAFEGLFRRLGLSIDWRQQYATIDRHCRLISQRSFRDLYEKGHLYNRDAPTAWDVDFQTAVAQAEMEERSKPGAFHHIEFAVEADAANFVIATTRPELLPACVGVTAHPDDPRYKGLFGKKAVTPLFRVPVPIFPSELADPEKGTGILMVCTFGDQTDVQWWREERLELRQLIGRNGTLMPVTFGSDEFPSANADAANRYYGEIAGKGVTQARKAIVELLRDPDAAAAGGGVPLQAEPEPIEHNVKFYEKGDRPLELVPTRQWFVRLLDKQSELLAKGEQVKWHPNFMHSRFRDWTEGLNADWCISRQRYFGVPIPVWYRLDENGMPNYDDVLVAETERMPVDPTTDAPTGFDESQRDQPGGFTGESDIFDTWFTSSLTPQIGSHWTLDADRHGRLFPADIRPQSHEIIRTWAFYTIAKAMLHEGEIPWKHVVISGWVLDPDRKKMSKSQGNVLTPMPLIEKFSADGARYWSASARLGTDTAADEKVFKVGKRLATKLFNAGKFVLGQTAEVHPIQTELDRAFVAKLRGLIERATASFEDFNHAQALSDTESFFWTHFTDTYLELAKTRARGEEGDGDGDAERGSAVASLRLALDVLLRLFAPFIPYITEEVWSWAYAEEKGDPSIHRAAWPSAAELDDIAAPASEASFDLAVACWNAINKAKADSEVSMGREVETLTIAADAETLAGLEPVLGDVLAATRCRAHTLAADASVESGSFAVRDARFAPKPD